jgi:hypothetical protein
VKTLLIPAALAIAVLSGCPAWAIEAGQPAQCATGPVEKTYGGLAWLVVSCSDGKSLVFVAKEGSKAAPFEFDMMYSGDGYDLTGKGQGDRKATDAAYGDLSKITGTQVRALVEETQKTKHK